MACPTCDHTMVRADHQPPNNDIIIEAVFWCPRCGTLRTESESHIGLPKIVERCRKLKDRVQGEGFLTFGEVRQLLISYGITESIDRPGR